MSQRLRNLWKFSPKQSPRINDARGRGYRCANKPKALSAPLTAELRAKTRGEGRGVLFNKTPPCPNKSGPFLAHDEQLWSLLRKSEAKRLVLPRNDAICIRMSQAESLLRKRMQSYLEKSRTSQVRPRVGMRLKRSLDGYGYSA